MPPSTSTRDPGYSASGGPTARQPSATLSLMLATVAGSRPAGRRTSMWAAKGTRTRSDSAPPQRPPRGSKPYMDTGGTAWQLPVRPERQQAQRPQPIWKGTMTRSPGAKPVTAPPTATTSPTNSWPIGNGPWNGVSPRSSATSRSQAATASGRTRASSAVSIAASGASCHSSRSASRKTSVRTSALGEGRGGEGERRGGDLLRPHQLLLAVDPLEQRLRHDAGAVRPELHRADDRVHAGGRDRVADLLAIGAPRARDRRGQDLHAGVSRAHQRIRGPADSLLVRVVQLLHARALHRVMPARREHHEVAVLAEVLRPDLGVGGADEERKLGGVAQLLHLLHEGHAVGRGGQRQHHLRVRGPGLQDDVGEVLGARRVLAGEHHLVAGGLARFRPRRRHLAPPVGLLLEDRDGLRPLRRRDQPEQPLGGLADVGRLPERREEIAEALLVDLLQREGHADFFF